jgi:shikimate dehydrogenase
MQSIYGLLGYPLSHSFSPNYFKNKWQQLGVENCNYHTFEFENINEAVTHLKAIENLKGFNITIPHKQNILPFLHKKMESVIAIGACNCVRIINNQWVGENTDFVGFMKSFSSILPVNKPMGKALVLGNGGAAKAVFYALKLLGISYSIVERKTNINLLYEDLNHDLMQQYSYIINTTPIGTYPNINEAPKIPYVSLTPHHIAYDLVYNPQETLFLQQCKNQGATIKNGSDMLVIQADESWQFWSNI